MKKEEKIKRSLFSVWKSLAFFLLISFVVTCSMLLFLEGMDLPHNMVKRNAPLVFGNILFLTLVFSVIDGLRRKYTIQDPVNRILEATRQMAAGDFSARIEPLHIYRNANEFDLIIENFNKMAEELSGTESLRTDFIANVSHELKTPLSVMQNYAMLLQSPTLSNEKRQEYAKIIANAAGRLTDLITNILKLNKLENQQIYPVKKPYNMGEQLCECLLVFEDIWESKEIELVTDIADDVIVEADSELLTLVWNNLFSNAMKFTDPEGKVEVSLKADGVYAYVSVRDSGCGMSPEVGRHIFEKFYQADKSHATQGNGLGLALVKRVIDIVGGDIRVESEPGRGSTFIVRIRQSAAA